MEDYRLPASLVGMLKATRLTGIPRIQTDLQTATLAVTITWELASSTTKKKTTKPPTSKKTAPTTKKKKKSPSPSTESSEPPKKSSTPPPPPKPTPPPSPKPTPVPSPPKPSPKPTPQSPKKANLSENVQRLTKVATRRLAQQGGLTPEPKPVTPQPSAPCPEVLSPQVTARRVGPPPTAVSPVKEPPSPMQVDNKPIDRIPYERLNLRAKDYLKFISKGNRPAKVFAPRKQSSEIVAQFTRPDGKPPHYVIYCSVTQKAYVLKAPDSKYHIPSKWEAANVICERLSHSQARKSLPCDKKFILSDIAGTQFYRAFPFVE